MIKLIIFDLDGVLAKTEHIHDEALTHSIASLGLTNFEHIIGMQGTTTRHKLEALKNQFGLADETINLIDRNKQFDVLNRIANEVTPSITQHNMLRELSKKYVMGIGSNARKENVDAVVNRLGIRKYFLKVLSNTDIKLPKPDPEIFLTIIAEAGVSPEETLVLEDSSAGREAVLFSGAHLFPVKDITDVTLENIENAIEQINTNHNRANGRNGQ